MGDMADRQIEQMQNPEMDDYESDYKCSICKYNEDKYIRICYDCKDGSKWRPKDEEEINKRCEMCPMWFEDCLVCSALGVNVNPDNCYLTTNSFERIWAEIKGEWRCDTCDKYNGCTVKWSGPCIRWQRKIEE